MIQKYEYDNSPIKIGDVVEMQHDWSMYSQPKGTLSIVEKIVSDKHIAIKDSRKDDSTYSSSYLKKVKTKDVNEFEPNKEYICTYWNGSMATKGKIYTEVKNGYLIGNTFEDKITAKENFKELVLVDQHQKLKPFTKEYADYWQTQDNTIYTHVIYRSKVIRSYDNLKNHQILDWGITGSFKDKIFSFSGEITKEEKELLLEQWDIVYGTPKPKKEISINQDIQNCCLSEINIESFIDNSPNAWAKAPNYSTQNKGNNMNETTTVEVKVNGQVVSTNVDIVKRKPKTDLEKEQTEKAGKHIVEWFNPDGFKMNTMHMTPKQVKKELQKPQKLGWTYRLYKIEASETTDIPTKSLEV